MVLHSAEPLQINSNRKRTRPIRPEKGEMKISAETHRMLMALLDKVEAGNPGSEKTRADLSLVRASTREWDDGAEIYGGTDVVAALKRLTKGRLEPFGKGSISTSAARFKDHVNPASLAATGATALEIYRRSTTLQKITKEMLENDTLLAKFLLARRDMIAAENMMAAGEIDSPIQPGLDLSKRYSIATLINALAEAGRIPDPSERSRLHKEVASPLDALLSDRENLEPAARAVMELGINERIPAVVRWFLSEPHVQLRSVLAGDHIAFLVLTNHRELIEMAPAGMRNEFELAAWKAPHFADDARRTAVEALKSFVEFMDAAVIYGQSLSEEQTAWVAWLKTILEWNIDALKAEKKSAETKGGGGTGGGGSPSAHGSKKESRRFGGVIKGDKGANAGKAGDASGHIEEQPAEGPADRHTSSSIIRGALLSAAAGSTAASSAK